MVDVSLPQRVLVLGPADSGKSAVAEDLVRPCPSVVYVATGPMPGPDDAEWAAKVAAHRVRRPGAWGTVETDDTDELCALLTSPGPVLLVESLGTWLASALERGTAADESARLAAAWRAARRDVVLVAEETGWGVVPATPVGRAFRSALGRTVAALAPAAQRVLLVVAGRVLELPPDRPVPLTARTTDPETVIADRPTPRET